MKRKGKDIYCQKCCTLLNWKLSTDGKDWVGTCKPNCTALEFEKCTEKNTEGGRFSYLLVFQRQPAIFAKHTFFTEDLARSAGLKAKLDYVLLSSPEAVLAEDWEDPSVIVSESRQHMVKAGA